MANSTKRESSEMDFSHILCGDESAGMSVDSENSDENVTDILEQAKSISMSLLPEKSAERYLLEYKKFCDWKSMKNIPEKCDLAAVLMVYFAELQSKFKPNTLWVKFSMLRTTIERNENVDISYPKLITLLKKNHKGYRPKKAVVFEAEDVSRFLSEADDREHLCTKVIMIFGVYGATRSDELVKLKVADVCEKRDIFLVQLLKTKTDPRSFTIQNEYAEIVRRYIKLRKPDTPHDRFFVNFQKGKCTFQVVGKNKFMSAPKVIADFLNLPDPKSYTGHSFRRTSATLLVEGGGDVLALKQHGGWKSSSVAEGYVENSITNKMKINGKIAAEIKKRSTVTSTITSSNVCSDADKSSVMRQSVVELTEMKMIASSAANAKLPLQEIQIQHPGNHFSDLHGCTFNFYSH